MAASTLVFVAAFAILTQGLGPAVFWVSSPVAPGETAMICGHFPQPESLVVGVDREPDNGAKASPARPTGRGTARPAREAKVLEASETALKFELPDLGGPGVYRVTLLRRADQSAQPVAVMWINAPEIWWLTGDAGYAPIAEPINSGATVYASPGGWLHVVGRCLVSANGPPRLVLREEPAGGRQPRTLELEAQASLPRQQVTLEHRAREANEGTSGQSLFSPWHLVARLPETAPVGFRGRLTLHSGHGSATCWADSGGYVIQVAPRTELPSQLYELSPEPPPAEGARAPFPETTVTQLSVRDFGADGDDSADDTVAIQAALDAAAQAPGVALVTLPRGRFLVTAPLTIPPHTMLAGAGQDLTAIAIPDTKEPPPAWIEGTHHFALQDLTIYCSNHQHIISGAMSGNPGESGHVCLRRVRVRGDAYRGHLTPEEVDARLRASLKLSTGGGDTVRFSGPDVVVTDCDLYGSGRSLYYFAVNGGLVTRNRLHNGRWGWYNFNVCRDVVFADNALVGADLMSTGGGYACYGPLSYSENIYTGRNSYELMHGWDREAFTSDAGGGSYLGGIATANAANDGQLRLELADEPKWGGRPWQGALFAVVAGRGRGFHGRLLSYENKTVTIQPLVEPRILNLALGDPPNWATLFDSTSQATITQMHRRYVFEGCRFSDAGIGIQYYGTSVEGVAVGNSTRRSGGFHGLGITYGGGVQPNLFCQWLDNEILEGNSYRFGANNAQVAGPSHLAVVGRRPSVNLGSVVRGNHLLNNALIEVESSGGVDAVENVVIERNTVEHSQVGIRVSQGVGVLYRDNRFVDCAREVYDAAAEVKKWRAAVTAMGNRKEPLAWWSFDEKPGAKVFKATSPIDIDLTTTLQGTADFADGVVGKALKLDGKSYAEVASDSASFALNLSNFTVAAWIYPEVIKGRWGILSKRTGHAPSPFVLGLRDGCLVYEAMDEAGQWTSYNFASPPVLKAGEWQHVAAVVEEGKSVVLYVNGEPVATRELQGQKLATNEQALRIGWEAWGGDPPDAAVPGYFTGLIDEVKIWARPLSAEEVAKEARRP